MSWNDFLPELAVKHEVLESLYADIGTPKEAKAKECQILFDKFLDVINNHIQHVEQEKVHMLSQCEQLLVDIKRMTGLVGQGEEGLNKLAETIDGMTLWDRHKLLQEEYSYIYEHYTQKLEEIRALHHELAQYATILGSTYVNPGPYPEEGAAVSFDVIQQFSDNIATCETEQKRRISIVESTIITIKHLWTELGLTAQDSFERQILDAEHDSYPISDEAMRRLETKQSMLEDERSKRESIVKEHLADITRLWDKLRIDEDEREDFITSHVGLTMDTIRAYKSELNRLEELKSQKIQEFILDERDLLYELWDKLYYSLEQRKSFAPVLDDNFTDESLAAHEAEVARLRQEVTENEHILDAIEQYRRMLDEIREFEITSMDAQRLFNRDPGRLLREEKFRKKIAREFPKIESELEDALYEWQQLKGRPFLVYGEIYIKTMKHHAQQAREGKENEKLWREQRRYLSLQRDLRYGSQNPKKTAQSPHPRRISPADLPPSESSGCRSPPPTNHTTPQPQTPTSKRIGLVSTSRPGTPSSSHVRTIPSFYPTTPTKARSQTHVNSGQNPLLQSPRSFQTLQLQRQNSANGKFYSRSESPATSFSLSKMPSTPSKHGNIRSSGPPIMMTTEDSNNRRSNSIISISSTTTEGVAEPSTPTRTTRIHRPISFDLTRQSIQEEDHLRLTQSPRDRKRTVADMSSPPGSPSVYKLRRKSRSPSPQLEVSSSNNHTIQIKESPFVSKTTKAIDPAELATKKVKQGDRFIRQLLKIQAQEIHNTNDENDENAENDESDENMATTLDEEDDSVIELDQAEAEHLFSTAHEIIEVVDEQEVESEGWETENDESPRSRRQSKAVSNPSLSQQTQNMGS